MIDIHCAIISCKEQNTPYSIYCLPHRSMEIKYGTPTPKRICADPSCDNEFEFQGYKSGIHLVRKGPGEGTAPYCLKCSALLKEYKGHPLLHKTIFARVSRVYVIKMLIAQGFKCASCSVNNEKLHVDHDHSCCEFGCYKCVRYLLCKRCNYIAGYLETHLERVSLVAKLLGIEVGIE